jgi:hypothetical protein
MIRKSIITALAFLLAYHFLYPSLPKKFYRINGQQRQNHDRANAYAFDAKVESHVIIGSSMSWELSAPILGPDWRKLSFPGCSVLTAFEIMRGTERYPDVLLVETNQCFADADKDIVADALNPMMAPLRRRSPVFLEEGRPSNFVAGIAEAFVKKGCKIGDSLSGKGSDTENEFAVPAAEVLEQIMELNRKQWDLPVDEGPVNARVQRIGEHVDFLRGKGVICILFEMPVDSSLTNLNVPRTVRHAMRARFPQDRYDWLAFDQTHNYATRDGIHLRQEASEPLTREILRQVDAIVSSHGSLGDIGGDAGKVR